MIPENYTGFVLFTAPWTGSDVNESIKQILSAALNRRQSGKESLLLEIEESEDNGEIFDETGIEVVPCVVGFREGREWGRVVGVERNELIKLVEKGADVLNTMNTNSVNTTSESVNTKESVNAISDSAHVNISTLSEEELKALVNGSKLMLFIKGTPETPRCGFTGQLIRLLTSLGLLHPLHYATFNILADERVREGLKVWAQWPTYPQVYWMGELVGGLDIVKEMVESGQMSEIVNELLK